ncbi:MAG: hypothetical protein WCV50_03055 [Patescibacteria group bacterium]|jgi:hypothetical protein
METPQKNSIKITPLLIIIVVVLAIGVGIYAAFVHDDSTLTIVNKNATVRNTNLNTNAAAQNTNVATNASNPAGDTVTGEFQSYYHEEAPWSNYNFYYKNGKLYHYLSATLAESLDVGFDASTYHVQATRYGLLFWKKGETKTTRFDSFGDQDIEYETGVNPEFYLFNTSTLVLTKLPNVSPWVVGSEIFEQVYNVNSSINQSKIIIEIGKFDIHSQAFEPGLVSPQPLESRGIVYDIASNSFTNEDPISIYKSAHHVSTTLFDNIIWDSGHDVLVAVPYGEGCGSFSTISFINLKTKTEETVGSPKGEWGGYDYINETCNPHNGASPDGKWQILYGEIEGNQTKYRLYSPETTSEVLKTVTIDGLVSPKSWDLSGRYPVITNENGTTVDFNV